LNGPIIKVYKSADEDNSGPHATLIKEMAFPIIKNFKNEEVAPSNLLLFNNESNLVFLD
jgi:hypothetical protein